MSDRKTSWGQARPRCPCACPETVVKLQWKKFHSRAAMTKSTHNRLTEKQCQDLHVLTLYYFCRPSQQTKENCFQHSTTSVHCDSPILPTHPEWTTCNTLCGPEHPFPPPPPLPGPEAVSGTNKPQAMNDKLDRLVVCLCVRGSCSTDSADLYIHAYLYCVTVVSKGIRLNKSGRRTVKHSAITAGS